MEINLAGLLPLLTGNDSFLQICARLDEAVGKSLSNTRLDLDRLSSAVRPLFLAALQSCLGHPLLVITARPLQARTLAEQTAIYSSQPELVFNWLTPDNLPYERLSQDTPITAGRLNTLAALKDLKTGDASHLVVVASAKGLMQPTLSKNDFAKVVVQLTRGHTIDLNRTLSQLVEIGYSAESVVDQPGQFSRRGGILDLWPLTADLPVRLELFGDEIESLRRFDPVSQRSLNQITSITITPPLEVPLWRSSEAFAGLKTISSDSLRPEVKEEWDRILNRVEDGASFEGIEQFMPYYTGGNDLCSLIDHLPSDAVVIMDGPAQTLFAVEELSTQAENLRSDFEAQGEMPAGLIRPYFVWAELDRQFLKFPRLYLNRTDEAEDRLHNPTQDNTSQPSCNRDKSESNSFHNDGQPPANETFKNTTAEIADLFQNSGEYVGQPDRLMENIGEALRDKQRVVIVSIQAERLREQFEDHDLFPVLRKEGGQSNLSKLPSEGAFYLLSGSLISGWRSADLGLTLLTDREIFGWIKQPQGNTTAPDRKATTSRTASQREAFLKDLKPGDYVVHIEHGIARYEGLIKLKAENSAVPTGQIEREYLFLKYAEQDKLYVPIEQVDRVLPYTAPGQAVPALNRLGSTEWNRTKRKVRQAVEETAKELLALYSARAVKEGHAFQPDTNWQREMEEAFPFTETPDQLRAVFDVKADMEQPRPMDRLICGDVGYGKTEVALRAAFKAVLDGKQVALLVPTTILAQQHYNTFSQRLAAFPTEIQMLSRFRSKKQQAETLDGLRQGKVDIVIGTHRLLQKDVGFKDLGLLIVDEEQRFGVKHKERLKQMRHEVDVLTLSATPIPRTLQMSLVGVRDMSIIQTPPEQRLPVKTYVTAYNSTLIREVIIREIERGGQVFFVHNRVQSISQVAGQLKLLLPEARVIVAHGQMEEGELEKVMLQFTDREADVLVCTTIIESGLDIPNANTLIVDNAITYGLAQLYQLRGRVGRSTNRAYAYFLYKGGSILTEDAQKRLDTMLDTQELGAGFKIAMKDLEIRGAGNLLGAEQSGQIGAVGFELYIRMLEEAIEQQKGTEERPIEAQVEAPTVNLLLPLPAYLPEEYVSDPAIRLDMYRKLAAPLQAAGQIRELVRELEDRFGELPEPARNLMYLLNIKVLAIRAGIEGIIEQEGEIFIRWPAPSLETEMRRVASNKGVDPKPAKPKTGGRATVDVRRLMKEFGESLRITPNQMRLNTRLFKEDWTIRLQELLEELVTN